MLVKLVRYPIQQGAQSRHEDDFPHTPTAPHRMTGPEEGEAKAGVEREMHDFIRQKETRNTRMMER